LHLSWSESYIQQLSEINAIVAADLVPRDRGALFGTNAAACFDRE
jgi:hypothetical protein